MYILLDTDKYCDLLHDRPVLSTGNMSHNKKNSNCVSYNQNLVVSSGGAQRQDRQLQSSSDSDNW
jgi:hypothetical protein